MERMDPDPELDALVRQLNEMSSGENTGSGEDDKQDEGSPSRPVAALPLPVDLAVNPDWKLPKAGAEGRERLDALLAHARESTATDLLLVSGAAPVMRIDGRLQALSKTPLSEADMTSICAAAVPKARRDIVARRGAVDFGFSRRGIGRFRGNVHRERGRWAAAFRLFPLKTPSLVELNLPKELTPLADLAHGLVIVSGPTGSGKSSTLAALLAEVMQRRTCHVITIEDPIEYEHVHGQCVVEQIEVGSDASTFAEALRAALRQDPDVILVGEMRDPETIATALTAAETGHLVLSTLHTGGAAQTMSRILDAHPSKDASVVRSQLAASLEAVVSQQLVPLSEGTGRVPVVEVMRATDAVRNLIRKGQPEQIGAQVSLGKTGGMLSFDGSLAHLVQRGLIEYEDAKRRARHPGDFDLLLRG